MILKSTYYYFLVEMVRNIFLILKGYYADSDKQALFP